MVLLHAGAPPSPLLAVAALLTLAVAIFIAAAVISDLQREEQPPAAKRDLLRRSRPRAPRAER